MNQTSAARLFEDLITAVRLLETEGSTFLCSIALSVLETEGPETLGPETTAIYRNILLRQSVKAPLQ
jgi:hypothetical protein